MARAADCLIAVYQIAVRPVLPPACRFSPTCSEYARDALAGHGFVRGVGLALWRLTRCHPFHAGGLDPVPPSPRNARERRS